MREMQLLRSDRLWSGSFLRPTTDGYTSAYRPEIDGLRAISVLLVIAFHFGMPGVPGGFIGVDLFFVISGYLITDIILREMKEGTFTVIGFYETSHQAHFPRPYNDDRCHTRGRCVFPNSGDYATGARSEIRAVLSEVEHPFLPAYGGTLTRLPNCSRCSTLGRLGWKSSSISFGRCCCLPFS
jgi:hypothetical protein